MQRRGYLTSAAVTWSTLGAGCLGLVGDGGGSDDAFGSVARWAVGPTTQARSYTGYRVETMAPARLLAATSRSVLRDVAEYRLGDSPGFRAIGADSIDRAIVVDTDGYAPVRAFTVFRGSFETQATVATLQDRTSAWSHVGTHGGYDCYAAGNNDPLYAIRDGSLVEIGYQGRVDDRNALETVIDTGAGDADRLQGRQEGFQLLVERLDPGVVSNVFFQDPSVPTAAERGRFEGTIVVGSSAAVDDGTWQTETVRVFREPTDHATPAVSAYLDRVRSAGTIESLQVERDGRVLHTRAVQTERPPFGGA